MNKAVWPSKLDSIPLYLKEIRLFLFFAHHYFKGSNAIVTRKRLFSLHHTFSDQNKAYENRKLEC